MPQFKQIEYIRSLLVFENAERSGFRMKMGEFDTSRWLQKNTGINLSRFAFAAGLQAFWLVSIWFLFCVEAFNRSLFRAQAIKACPLCAALQRADKKSTF